MAVDGAPNFASRMMLHFCSFAGGLCTTAAGHAGLRVAKLREFLPFSRQSAKRRAATVCIFCNKVLRMPDGPKWASSKNWPFRA
jgi:hypothetical protein